MRTPSGIRAPGDPAASPVPTAPPAAPAASGFSPRPVGTAPAAGTPPRTGCIAATLSELRSAGASLALGEVAARIVASPVALPQPLARQIVAGALGLSPAALPDPVAPELLGTPAQSPDVALERATFAVVDLETTGLSCRRAGILEIGAVRVEALRIVSRFETLVRPEGPVPPRITALTGITGSMVAGAPVPGEALGWLRDWLDETPGAPFVAHNARFDEGFVRRGLARHGLGTLEGPVLCTCKLARRLAPELGSFGLDRVAGGFGIRIAARHRALGDAEATAEALLHLVDRARRDHGARTVEDLLAIQRRSPRALRSSSSSSSGSGSGPRPRSPDARPPHSRFR